MFAILCSSKIRTTKSFKGLKILSVCGGMVKVWSLGVGGSEDDIKFMKGMKFLVQGKLQNYGQD